MTQYLNTSSIKEPPLPMYLEEETVKKPRETPRCIKCGGTHPSFISCRGPIAPPRIPGYNPVS